MTFIDIEKLAETTHELIFYDSVHSFDDHHKDTNQPELLKVAATVAIAEQLRRIADSLEAKHQD